MRPEPSDLSAPPSGLDELTRLLEEHRPRLLAMLSRRLSPALAARTDAEELLAEAFLRARQRWASYRAEPAITPKAWLHRIARDCLVDAWRQHTRQCRDLRRDVPWPEASSVQLGLGLINPGTSPSSAAGREEMRQRLLQALALLKEADREILWLRHCDGLTYPEAAEVLGIEVSAATLRCVRATERFTKLWRELWPQGGVP